ncbi:MAG: hypothetical protein ABW200_13465, partial [Hyphomicrobiaceae bacterium]
KQLDLSISPASYEPTVIERCRNFAFAALSPAVAAVSNPKTSEQLAELQQLSNWLVRRHERGAGFGPRE